MKTMFLTIAALLVSGSVMALDATVGSTITKGADLFVVAGKSVGNTGVGPALRNAGGLSGVQVTGVLNAIKAIELKKGAPLTQADYASMATAANGQGLSLDATLKQLSATANGNKDAAFNVVFASSAQTTTASSLPKAPQASNVNTDPVLYVTALVNDLSVNLEDRADLKALNLKASLKDANALKQVAAIAKLAPLARETSAAHCGDLDSKTCEEGRLNQLVRFGLTDFALTVGGIGFEEETLKGFLGQEGADAYATPVYVGSSFGILGEVRAGRQISPQLFACLNGTNPTGSASGLVSK